MSFAVGEWADALQRQTFSARPMTRLVTPKGGQLSARHARLPGQYEIVVTDCDPWWRQAGSADVAGVDFVIILLKFCRRHTAVATIKSHLPRVVLYRLGHFLLVFLRVSLAQQPSHPAISRRSAKWKLCRATGIRTCRAWPIVSRGMRAGHPARAHEAEELATAATTLQTFSPRKSVRLPRRSTPEPADFARSDGFAAHERLAAKNRFSAE